MDFRSNEDVLKSRFKSQIEEMFRERAKKGHNEFRLLIPAGMAGKAARIMVEDALEAAPATRSATAEILEHTRILVKF